MFNRRCTKDPDLHWEGEHSVTRHKLVVKPRADRGYLCSLYEQERQILQVRPNLFADMKTVVQFMVAIAKEYAADRFSRSALKRVRDEKLASMGVALARAVLRKPAAKRTAPSVMGICLLKPSGLGFGLWALGFRVLVWRV